MGPARNNNNRIRHFYYLVISKDLEVTYQEPGTNTSPVLYHTIASVNLTKNRKGAMVSEFVCQEASAVGGVSIRAVLSPWLELERPLGEVLIRR